MLFRSYKSDKQESLKATLPAVPTTWDAAEGLQYAKGITDSFHAYLESAQYQSLTDRGFIQAWLKSIRDAKSTPWKGNTEIMNLLGTAASHTWTFQETLYHFCWMAKVETDPTALVNTYRRMVQQPHETAEMYIGGMAIRSQTLLKHLGGAHQAIEIAIEGLLNKIGRAHV